MSGLFIKNSLEERQLEGLSLAQLVKILKLIRRNKYILYKQTATFAINIAQQTRNNINSQVIEQFINGPESHVPGYVGYIPAVKSENLYAKTYGKIT